jgi:DNA-binding response OmpR family regulator
MLPLLDRVDSKVRTPTDAGPAPAVVREPLAYGGFVFDPASFSLSFDGRDIPLTYLEVLLLTELMHHPLGIVRYERLLALVHYTANRHSAQISVASLRRKVGYLRSKLARAGAPCIRTMHRVGYGFVPPAKHPR